MVRIEWATWCFHMLEIEDLTVEVGGKEVLHDVNLSVMAGYTNVLFGPNGSGKSTLLMTIMGFSGYKITKGRILFNGEDITNVPVSDRAKKGIGLMMQRPPNLVGVKLGNLVKVMSHDRVDPQALAKDLDLTTFLQRDVNVGFSGGEIKRSELMQLEAQNPCLVMLDEPESGVDMVSIQKVGAQDTRPYPRHLMRWRQGPDRQGCPGNHPYRADPGLRGGGPRLRHVQGHHRLHGQPTRAAA